MIEHLEANMPPCKVCAPEDIAEAIIYFAGTAAVVTGEACLLDGGMSIGRS